MGIIKFTKYLLPLIVTMNTGCMSINYTSPYTGEIDPNRDYKSEGLLSASLSLIGNGFRFGEDHKEQPPAGCPVSSNNFRQNANLGKSSSRLKTHLDAIDTDYIISGSTLIINIPYNEGYELNNPHLKQTQNIKLDKLATLLAEDERLIIEIAGHANQLGGLKSNQSLSRLRALNMARYFSASGIEKNRLFFAGFGEDYLSPFGNDAKRVELFICDKA